MNTMTTGAARALRATGAMFFSVFGALWLEGWAIGGGRSMPVLVLIALLALALFWVSYRTYRQNAPELAARPDTPQARRAKRLFHTVNATQWILVAIGATLLSRHGMDAWIVPMIILVVGLHFLPLAWGFSNPLHYVTGAMLVLLAIAYPNLAPAGPADTVGLFGAGLILWLSALWALRP